MYSSIRTGGTVTIESAAFSYDQTLDNAGWRRMDYGFALGGGFEYPFEKGIWVFDLRYDYSVIDAHKSDATFNSNKTFGVSITYLFDFVDLYFRMKNKNHDNSNENPEGESQNNNGLKVDRSN